MFERSKIDNSSRNPLPCELVLKDGRELLGHLLVTSTRSILDELNAPGGFAEFETLDRQRTFLAKETIRTARSAAVAKIEPLEKRIREGMPFDPHQVLGVAKTADRETIRRAYHTLAKAYHPDRIQAFELPVEMADYATAMAKRINAAYSALTAAGANASDYADAATPKAARQAFTR